MEHAVHPTAEERFFFESNGYLVLDRFLPQDLIASLLARLEQAIEHRRDLNERGEAHHGKTVLRGANSRLFYLLDDDPLFLDMLTYKPMMAYVTSLFNQHAHFHASDAIWEVDDDSHRANWHIDGIDKGFRNLRPTIPFLQLKVGYYLNDMSEPGQGNLMLVPGSHKVPFDPSPEMIGGYDTFPGAIQVCGAPGTCFLFHNAVWHTSGPWTKSDSKRIVLYYAYEHPWMLASPEHTAYPKSFYHQLSAENKAFFHNFLVDA